MRAQHYRQMRWTALLFSTLAAANFAASMDEARAQPAPATISAASRAALKETIKQSSVTVMNPAVIAVAPGVVAQPKPADQAGTTPATPADTGPTSTPAVAEEATVPGAPIAGTVAEPPVVAAEVAPAPTIIAPPHLKAGRLYFVKLPARQEADARALVAEQVAASTPEAAATVQSFNGVVRQVAADDTELQLKSYVLVGQPLTFNRDARKFVGTVAVGVANLDENATNAALSAPLLFQVLETRQQVSLNHVSPPFEYFDVSTDTPGRTVVVRVASNFSREGVSITVPVEPTLFVELDNDNLRGLGMQTTRVTVRAVGGATVPTGTVSVSAPGAFVIDDAPKLNEQGLAHTEIRSDSPGQVLVTANATGFQAGERPLTVVWPWQTLAATIIGGLMGGFIRLGSGIRRGMNVLRFLVGLVIATFIGILVFALYVLGVRPILPVDFAVVVGDLFAFAAAALGGWLGTGVLPQPRGSAD